MLFATLTVINYNSMNSNDTYYHPPVSHRPETSVSKHNQIKLQRVVRRNSLNSFNSRGNCDANLVT